MNAEEFKIEVKSILNSGVKFDGHINKVINSTTIEKQKIIIKWIKECYKESQIPEPCKRVKDAIAFIYKSKDNKIRGILTKKKNSFFIELFLDKHKYYDQKRKYLGIYQTKHCPVRNDWEINSC